MRNRTGTLAAILAVTIGVGATTLATPASAQLDGWPGYGYGYGYSPYGAANPTIVGLAFWSGQPYTYWACKLGVDFQCPSSPAYAYGHRGAATTPVATTPASVHRHRPRHRS